MRGSDLLTRQQSGGSIHSRKRVPANTPDRHVWPCQWTCISQTVLSTNRAVKKAQLLAPTKRASLGYYVGDHGFKACPMRLAQTGYSCFVHVLTRTHRVLQGIPKRIEVLELVHVCSDHCIRRSMAVASRRERFYEYRERNRPKRAADVHNR